jgi:phosphopantothenoylcysteine synthetase/decarboxylase
MSSVLVSKIEAINQQELKRNEFEYQLKRTQKILKSTVKNFAKFILARASQF